MSPLAKYLFIFLLNHTGPGNSPYSFELLPSCGMTEESPSCPLEPVCSSSSPLCAAPRWNPFRSGWVRVESRESAALRYYTAATALARTATYLTRCTDERGSVAFDCDPVFWPSGPRSLACAALASSIWESGYREDIMTGAPPAGRGPDGEGCVMQVMPQYVAANVSWLTDEQKAELSPEEVIEMTLGTDQHSLERCYEAGARMLSRFRNSARYKCKGNWVYSMYSMYGTGGRCYPSTSAEGKAAAATQEAVENGQLNPVMLQGMVSKDWARDRTRTYERCMSRWPDGESMPSWASAVVPPSSLVFAQVE